MGDLRVIMSSWCQHFLKKVYTRIDTEKTSELRANKGREVYTLPCLMYEKREILRE